MFTLQQIKDAGETLVKMLDREALDGGYVDLVYATVDDLLLILDGKLKPAPQPEAKEVILVPGMGFVPVVGQVVDDDQMGNRVEWFEEDK